MPVASDLDRLYDHGQKLAKQLLESNGEFYPFGISIDLKGELRYVAAQDATALDSAHPQSQDLIEILSTEFKRQANNGGIRASGICCDVYVTDPRSPKKQDAIQCHLEHTNGDSVDVFLPYIKASTGRMDYLEAYSTTSQSKIFTKQQTSGPAHECRLIDLTLTLESQPALSPPTLAQLNAAVDFLTPQGAQP